MEAIGNIHLFHVDLLTETLFKYFVEWGIISYCIKCLTIYGVESVFSTIYVESSCLFTLII